MTLHKHIDPHAIIRQRQNYIKAPNLKLMMSVLSGLKELVNIIIVHQLGF